MVDCPHTHKASQSDWLVWLQWVLWGQWRSQDLGPCCSKTASTLRQARS